MSHQQAAEWSLTRALQQENTPTTWRLWQELCVEEALGSMSADARERVRIVASYVSGLLEKGQEITEARAQEIRALAGLGGA